MADRMPDKEFADRENIVDEDCVVWPEADRARKRETELEKENAEVRGFLKMEVTAHRKISKENAELREKMKNISMFSVSEMKPTEGK